MKKTLFKIYIALFICTMILVFCIINCIQNYNEMIGYLKYE